MNPKESIKNSLKLGLRKLFEAGQHVGIDVLPRHFYSEVPDIRRLKGSAQWKRPFSMVGVGGTGVAEQLKFVRDCCPPPIVETMRTKPIQATASAMNGALGFGTIEADFLYAFVATRKPAHVFQIGCGVSTAICLMAAEDTGHRLKITCVEPFPTEFIRRAASDGKVELLAMGAELLDLGLIESLDADLLFFVDSSHTLGPAGEVTRIILEMLPRLKPGSWVHFHDIMFPYDYDRHLLRSTMFFHHETALLHAFLAYNRRFELKASMSMLHYADPAGLAESLPNYRAAANDEGLEAASGHYPSSAYLRVVA